MCRRTFVRDEGGGMRDDLNAQLKDEGGRRKEEGESRKDSYAALPLPSKFRNARLVFGP
jgi:hypothetical protein